MRKNTVINIIIFFFILLYGLSILGKLLYPETFQSWIKSFLLYGIGYTDISSNATNAIFYATLSVELFLITSLHQLKSVILKLNFALCCVFLTVIAIGYILNLPADCGCFGDIVKFENSLGKLLFNIGLCVLSGLLIFLEKKNSLEEETLQQAQGA